MILNCNLTFNLEQIKMLNLSTNYLETIAGSGTVATSDGKHFADSTCVWDSGIKS